MSEPTTFEWQNQDALLAQVRAMLEARGGAIRRVPASAIRRGVFELLKLIQERAPKKTSTLVRSLHAEVKKLSEELVEGRVGTWLAYGRYLEEGTGVFGPKKRPIEIVAKTKRGLFWGAFDQNGKALIRRRVIVQGIKPRGYFAMPVKIWTLIGHSVTLT